MFPVAANKSGFPVGTPETQSPEMTRDKVARVLRETHLSEQQIVLDGMQPYMQPSCNSSIIEIFFSYEISIEIKAFVLYFLEEDVLWNISHLVSHYLTKAALQTDLRCLLENVRRVCLWLRPGLTLVWQSWIGSTLRNHKHSHGAAFLTASRDRMTLSMGWHCCRG